MLTAAQVLGRACHQLVFSTAICSIIFVTRLWFSHLLEDSKLQPPTSQAGCSSSDDFHFQPMLGTKAALHALLE